MKKNMASKEAMKDRRMAELQPIIEGLYPGTAANMLREIGTWPEEVYQTILAGWLAQKKAQEESRLAPAQALQAASEEDAPSKSNAPFIKSIGADGKPSWEMSPALLSAKADLEWRLKRIENITDKEMQRGLLAIEAMQHRVKRLARGGEELSAFKDEEYFKDYLSDNPPSPEEREWMVGFLMPFAGRLMLPMPPCAPEDKWEMEWRWLPQTREEAQRHKDDALAWVGKVIDWRFSDLLMDPQKGVIRANDLIPLALECCREIDGPPSRAELLSWLKAKGRDEFNLQNPNDLSVMWKLSGLAGLEKGKPGPDPGKKSRRGKFSHLPGVSYG